jgi:hypothetical protein
VHYSSAVSIGYRFRPRLILTASEDEKLGEPLSVDVGDHKRRDVRTVASRTGIRGRVSLLVLVGDEEPFMQGYVSDDAAPPRPVDFTTAIAYSDNDMIPGYLLSFRNTDRRIDFIAADGKALPVGTPVFLEDRFVGIAARNRWPPEQWILTFMRSVDLLLDEERRNSIVVATSKLLGDQLLALARSLKTDATRLWSLYELVETTEFGPYLRDPDRDKLLSMAPAEASAPNDAGSAVADVTDPARSSNDDAVHPEIVFENAPEGIWTPLGRLPRQFPLAPQALFAWTIVVLLAAIAAGLAVLGVR